MLDIVHNCNLGVVKYYFEGCSPDKIFDFLGGKDMQTFRTNSREDADDLEVFFYGLEQPLVNLGLACYGQNSTVISNLFQHEPAGVRLAVIGRRDAFQNSSRPLDNALKIEEVEAILLGGSTQDQQAMLQNPYLSSDIFKRIYRKTGTFESVSDEVFLRLVKSSVGNSKFSKLTEGTKDRPNYSDSDQDDFKQALDSAWSLSYTVPVNDDWAITLMGLYENLRTDVCFKGDLESTIESWRVPAQNEENTDAYESIRMCLACFIDINSDTVESLMNSEDIALRSSFYKRFTPGSSSDLEGFYSRDKEKFIFWALSNNSILGDKVLSEELGRLCIIEDSNDSFYRKIFDKRMRSFA